MKQAIILPFILLLFAPLFAETDVEVLSSLVKERFGSFSADYIITDAEAGSSDTLHFAILSPKFLLHSSEEEYLFDGEYFYSYFYGDDAALRSVDNPLPDFDPDSLLPALQEKGNLTVKRENRSFAVRINFHDDERFDSLNVLFDADGTPLEFTVFSHSRTISGRIIEGSAKKPSPDEFIFHRNVEIIEE